MFDVALCPCRLEMLKASYERVFIFVKIAHSGYGLFSLRLIEFATFGAIFNWNTIYFGTLKENSL